MTVSPVRQTSTLGNAVEFLDSQRRPVKASDRKAGPFPYYGGNGQQGTIDGYLFDEALVLVAEDGGHFFKPGRGIAYKISGKTRVNNHAHVLRPKPGVDIDYLRLVLKHLDVTEHLTGTTRAKLTKAGASRIQIPLPPLAQLDTLLQSTFLDLFGDPVTNPKGWPLQSGADVCSRITVGIVVKPASYYAETGVPALRSLNVRPNNIQTTDLVYISSSDNTGRLAKTRVWSGDILLVRSGQPGTAAIVSEHLNRVNAIDIPARRVRSCLLLRAKSKTPVPSRGGAGAASA